MTPTTLRGAQPPGTPTTARRRAAGRTLLAGGLALASAATGVLVAGTASAAVPAFPDNITVFPDRDFVSIDGFADRAGQSVTVEVVRGGTVIGATTGKFADKATIDAGNPALEINHPGGICWGVGGPNVTPDITAGDQIVLKAGGTPFSDARSLDTEVTDSDLDPADATTLIVHGRYGPDVNPTQLEQRIVNGDLRDTPVGFRDVRAVLGPMTPDRRNPTSYSSGLDAANGQFTATYKFIDARTAGIAAAGAMRAMSWQNQDAAANRQGVTIAEFGELGGPGFGGCPPAAAQSTPSSPTGVTAADAGNGTTTVKWTPVTSTPGTSPVIGYTVRAVSRTSTGGGQDEVGKRISDPAAASVTLNAPLAGNTFEVRSLTAAGESWPAAIANATTSGGASGDTVAPTVTAAPAGGQFATDVTVKLTSSEPGSIYYTLDGSDPLVAGDAGLTSQPYDPTTGVSIAAKDTAGNFVSPQTLRYVAFDAAGNPSLAKTETYTFGAATAPGAPTGVTAKAGNTTADVTWTAPAAGGSPVTGYKITATAQVAAADAPAVSTTALSSATTVSLTGLKNGATYDVAVVATSAAGDSAPGRTTVTPAATEVLTASAPSNKAGDFRVNGTSNAPSGNVSLFRADAANNPSGAVLATSTLTAAAPPAVGSTFALRARTTIAPGTKLVITGSNGGKLVITG